MKKEKVTFEQLAAGSLLKFGKLESADMALLIKEISKYAEIERSDDSLDKYFVMGDGSVLLNEKYVHKFYYSNMYDSLIEKVQGSIVEKYFSTLNITEFVLKKIKMIGLGFVVKDGLRDVFSKRQIDAMDELYKRGFIEDYMQEDDVYGDYEAIRVTQKGKVALFIADNRKEVRAFLTVLRNSGYSDKFLSEFLLAQDLNLPCKEILSIDNFTLFCDINGSEIDNKGISRRREYNKK